METVRLILILIVMYRINSEIIELARIMSEIIQKSIIIQKGSRELDAIINKQNLLINMDRIDIMMCREFISIDDHCEKIKKD